MMRLNREAHDASPLESPLRQISLLEHSSRKLEKIKTGLIEIEELERSYAFHKYRYEALEEDMLKNARRNTTFGKRDTDEYIPEGDEMEGLGKAWKE